MTVVKYVWDQQNVLTETDGANAITAAYTHAPSAYGPLISQRRSSTSHFALGDALGSVVALTTSAGAASDGYRYKAYGQLIVSAGSTTNPYRWVGVWGYQFDGWSGTYYVRARQFGTATGRWMSEDPFGYEGDEWNSYEYALSRPLTFSDPSGLWAEIPIPCDAALLAKCQAACSKGGGLRICACSLVMGVAATIKIYEPYCKKHGCCYRSLHDQLQDRVNLACKGPASSCSGNDTAGRVASKI